MYRVIFLLMTLLAWPAQASLVILQYHHVDTTTPAVTSVTPEVFREHMRLLEREGMQVVALDDAMQKLLSGETLPDRAVAITFDDAYQSIFDNAWPDLNARQWPFTVFVNTDAVDRRFPDMMSWDNLRTLQQAGALIANHTRTHPYLLETPADVTPQTFWEDEINGAEARILAETGRSPKLFAYPYGEYTPELALWLKQQGYLAFGQQSGAVGTAVHQQIIPRYPAAGVYADTKTLTSKLRSLPFAIHADQSVNPVLSDNPPTLTLEIPVEDFRASQVNCYAAGAGRLEPVSHVNDGVVTLQMQQPQPITSGRGRYNCTAQSLSQPDRYYWYSQLWINTGVTNR